MIDIRTLRHFLMLAETLHFGRAADRLGMTQPPLSQSIQALEAELGVGLFDRTRRSVALTPVGAAWLPHVKDVVGGALALPDIAARLGRGEIGTLRLAFVSTATYSLLPPLIGAYKDAFPEVALKLSEATSDVQVDGLLAGSLDAGLMIAPPGPSRPAQLEYKPLHREKLIAALPKSWFPKRRQPESIDFYDLAEQPMILFPRRSAPALHDLISGYFDGKGHTPRIGQEAVQMQTIIGLVSAGIGWAMVPAAMASLAREGVVYRDLSGAVPEMETGLAWRRDNAAPTLEAFRALAVRGP